MIKKRVCSNCGTPLRNGHGFPTQKGGIFCGRAYTMATVNGSFVKKYLGCNKW
jgi:hypothetical protein